MKKAILVGFTVTAIGAAVSKVLPGQASYLLAPGWLTVYTLCGGVHGDGTLLAVMNRPFVLYGLIGLGNACIDAGLIFIVAKIWKNFHST